MKIKPDPKADNKGCLIHDNICVDEQMKAGCAVELFICFNCEFLQKLGVSTDIVSKIVEAWFS